MKKKNLESVASCQTMQCWAYKSRIKNSHNPCIDIQFVTKIQSFHCSQQKNIIIRASILHFTHPIRNGSHLTDASAQPYINIVIPKAYYQLLHYCVSRKLMLHEKSTTSVSSYNANFPNVNSYDSEGKLATDLMTCYAKDTSSIFYLKDLSYSCYLYHFSIHGIKSIILSLSGKKRRVLLLC